MTLGGLALAVGILVDDATVTIENIERHMHLGSDLHKAILDGAGEIAVPALVSTLCICIVFVPMFFLTGVARYLFAPLAEAVVFAMLASYVLSRTLVPTLVMLMMDHAPARSGGPAQPAAAGLPRLRRALREDSRRLYRIILAAVLGAAPAVRRRCFWAFACCRAGWCSFSGATSFRAVDAGQIRLHMRLPTGTRIEETARVADQVEAAIRTIVPARDLGTDARQPGRADQRHQPVLQQFRDHRHAGRRDSGVAQSKAIGPPQDYIEQHAPRSAALVSGRGVFLPARRHGDADPEFRTARRHRRADHRRRSARQLLARRQAHEADTGGSAARSIPTFTSAWICRRCR